ncbi:MAG: thiamine diphosphokinase [Granulosicoccus sp.]
MSQFKRAWVFAGGEFSSQHFPDDVLLDEDIVVCVDAGLKHCLSLDMQPDLLVGDMDSVPPALLQDKRIANVERHVYPSKKASSDLQLALEVLSTRSVGEVVLLGVSGGRTDHMLFNWHLVLLRLWPFKIQLIDETMHTYVLEGEQRVEVHSFPGRTLSLLAMRSCEGVTTSGLQYPLSKASIHPGDTLGLSNVVETGSVSVDISSGTLLMMVQR